MSLKRKLVVFGCGWLILITVLHAWLNINWAAVLNDYRPPARRKIEVAYIPVTCQLTCPVTDYISKLSESGEIFLPRLFQGFPEIKEALISNRIQAAFIVAPLAIALRAQGVPIKVVYLGHRYGSAVVVRKDGPVNVRRYERPHRGHPQPLLR
jgi:NitT/TauT family transport system substrate-binding protein